MEQEVASSSPGGGELWFLNSIQKDFRNAQKYVDLNSPQDM